MDPFVGAYSIRGVETDHYTKNAVCPRCHSHIRHRFLVEFMRRETDLLVRPQRILHFAPEAAVSKVFRELATDYVTADIAPSRYEGAVYADITDLPFPSADFDAVICVHVLEHIPDDRRAIGELYRVLKPGGRALVAVPTYGAVTFEDPSLDDAGRRREYGTDEHVRLNGLDFADKLRDAGFDVTVVSLDEFEGDFFDRSSQSAHVDSDRYLFHCVK